MLLKILLLTQVAFENEYPSLGKIPASGYPLRSFAWTVLLRLLSGDTRRWLTLAEVRTVAQGTPFLVSRFCRVPACSCLPRRQRATLGGGVQYSERPREALELRPPILVDAAKLREVPANGLRSGVERMNPRRKEQETWRSLP